MIKNVALLAIILLLTGCSNNDKYTYYSYNETTITRVDKQNHIYFYSGKYKKGDPLPQACIEQTYSSYDGGMDAFLIFKDDGTVALIRVAGGLFKMLNQNDKFFLSEFKTNLEYINWERKIKENYLNIYRVSDEINLEIRLNKTNNSKVKVMYEKK